MGTVFKLSSPISLLEEGYGEQLPLVSENVIVLAENFKLSEAQKKVLDRGLTFIPTLTLDSNQKLHLQFDIQNYHRKIQLASYFRDNKRQRLPKFTSSSFWMPPRDKIPSEVIFLIQKDKKDFQRHFKRYNEKSNLSQQEKEALKQLMQNKHIVIKPADKGSAVVILSRQHYILEAKRQLNDKTYYSKLNKPIYLQTVPLVHQIIDKLHRTKFINTRQKEYLKGTCEPRPRQFYILPKIHKKPETWTIPFKLPSGRPIVSDCGSETYQTAEYIDYFLTPLSIKHPSYLKDTYHFIGIIKNLRIPPNSFFFTMDINSLYTNIDTKAGLKAIKNIFLKYPDPKRPDEEILQLLEINLTKNDFEFNKEYFLQIKGTAMGKRFSPAYANIFMAEWEEKALAKCPIKPLYYYRYLDDIFGIWSDTLEEFNKFLQILNSHDASIKAQHNIQKQSIDFLDTTIYKGQLFLQTQILDIKVHFKETDTHSLLFKTSFHPKHTYKGLIKSQLIRFKRICTQNKDFWEAVKLLFTTLRQRGYSRTFLRHCLKTFHKQGLQKQEEVIPLITTFSSISVTLNNKFKSNYQTIIQNQGLLQNHQVLSAYRRNSNLRDLLVRAKLPSIQQKKKTRNLILKNFIKLKYVYNYNNKIIFKIQQQFSPQSSNCIYIIFCARCGIQYIGETGQSISARMTQHRYNIRRKKHTDTLLVKHFISHGWTNLRVSGVQNNSSWTNQERKKMERRWIYLLSTKEPLGLNMKYN